MEDKKKQSTAEQTSKTGSKILLDTLLANGVTVCWGYPGGAILPLYDEVYHSKIEHILVRHEQGAAFAAEGYARATGKLGVAISTSGPGATNLLTGVADAKMDSIPVLFVTGQVATKDIGTDAFQEADTYGMSIPITKYNALVKDVDDVARVTMEAITVAMAGRQGPVLIDMPKDIQAASSNIIYHNEDLRIPELHYKKAGLHGDVKKLIDVINKAHRPLFYIGGGVISSGTSAQLLALVEKTQIPVTSTLMGLGAFPGEHDLFLGMLGMHGTAYANKAVIECDLIVALGARFDDRVALNVSEFASQALRAQVDIDIAEIGKRVDVDVHIAGDLADVLDALLEGAIEVQRPWAEYVQTLKKNNPLKFNLVKDQIKPQYFIHKLSEKTSGNAVIVTDVGQHQMWASQFYAVNKPRNWLTSGGLGSMGFGLPAAIGAKYGRPEDDVILITGDGSIQMNIQELATARMYNIPVKILLFHNGFLGMVRQWQELFYGERFSHSTLQNYNPDFCKIAEAYGIVSKKISRPEEIDSGIDFLLNTKDICLLEVMIPDLEKVYPMIPAGHRYEDMIEFKTESEAGELFTVIPHKSRQRKVNK